MSQARAVNDPCQQAPEAAPRLALVTESGAAAELDKGQGREVLRVRDPGGAILFEYDARAGKGTLRMPAGDLRLEAPQGDIELIAGKSVRCVSAGEVALRSATSASVTVGGPRGEETGLRMDRKRAALAAEELIVGARRAELRLRVTKYVGEAAHAAVARAELSFGELSTRAETLIEQAGNVFRHVKELHQLRAGRLRTLIEGALRIEGGHVVVQAREDVHIDGEHINLG